MSISPLGYGAQWPAAGSPPPPSTTADGAVVPAAAPPPPPPGTPPAPPAPAPAATDAGAATPQGNDFSRHAEKLGLDPEALMAQLHAADTSAIGRVAPGYAQAPQKTGGLLVDIRV